MEVNATVLIDAPKNRVWSLVTDIENAPRVIDGIEKIEVLERPATGLRGLKWVETRTLFGKEATETMWITEAVVESYYVTEARSHGATYRTEIRLADEGAGTRLSMRFGSTPESGVAKFMAFMLAPLMKRSVSKALQKDLEDVKRAAEKTS